MRMTEIKWNRNVVVGINEVIKVIDVALFMPFLLASIRILTSNNEARDGLSSLESSYNHNKQR